MSEVKKIATRDSYGAALVERDRSGRNAVDEFIQIMSSAAP